MATKTTAVKSAERSAFRTLAETTAANLGISVGRAAELMAMGVGSEPIHATESGYSETQVKSMLGVTPTPTGGQDMAIVTNGNGGGPNLLSTLGTLLPGGTPADWGGLLSGVVGLLGIGESGAAGAGVEGAAMVPAAGAGLAGTLGTVLGAAGAAYGLYQALGGGEGGGLFGLNILGGDILNVGGVTLSGPGVPEPSPSITEAHWKDRLGRHYYRVRVNGRRKTLTYDPSSNRWWVIKKPYLAVIGKNMPRHKTIVRLRKLLSKQSADARTILRITSPTSLKGYYKSRGKRR